MQSVSPKYYITLRDWQGKLLTIIDNWEKLSYASGVNKVGSYELVLQRGDPRAAMFALDYVIEVYRSVPGIDLSWYREFIGLHRKVDHITQQNGKRLFVSTGTDLYDMLARTIVGYHEGTINADKSGNGETVMKAYVEENCGASATAENYRLFPGVIPGFSVEPTRGGGLIWEGSRSFENLMDVVHDIATLTLVDFWIEYTADGKFVFRTFNNQMGIDRSYTGINGSTGKNKAGNSPTVFSSKFGNVQDMRYTLDRLSESNTVYVLGEGDGSTRTALVRYSDKANSSPFNRREIARPYTGYQYEMIIFGDEELNNTASKQELQFQPLQQASSCYGKHYNLGDKVTIMDEDITVHKRIVGVNITVQDNKETVNLEFNTDW